MSRAGFATLSVKTSARLAGLAYVLLVLTGIFSLAYAPGRLIELDDQAATLANLTAETALFRLAIAGELVCYAIFPVLLTFLHRVFARRGPSLALLMVLFAAVSVPISYLAVTEKLAALDIVAAGGDAPSLAAAVADRLEAYNHRIRVAAIFWGLWLFPLGVLVMKSGAIPRVLGLLLALGCAGYLANAFGPILHAGYRESVISEIASIPASLGEIGTALWLLVFGARDVDPADG